MGFFTKENRRAGEGSAIFAFGRHKYKLSIEPLERGKGNAAQRKNNWQENRFDAFYLEP